MKALIVKEADLAEQELADALMPYLRFSDSGDLFTTEEFDLLTTRDRVLCVLLAARALNALDRRDQPGMRNAEVQDLTGMPAGTVNPKLAGLKKDRIATKDGGYWVVAPYALRKVANELASKAKST
ncbi:MAG: hypothetical protein ACREX3_25440 [Gammaproteobacteria bacterium]